MEQLDTHTSLFVGDYLLHRFDHPHRVEKTLFNILCHIGCLEKFRVLSKARRE